MRAASEADAAAPSAGATATSATASTSPQKVLVPGSAYKTICQLRRGHESDGDVVSRAIRWLDTFDTLWRFGDPTELSFTLMEFARVSNSQFKMKAAGYSDEMAAAICRALFYSQSDEDLQEAFKFYDSKGTGSIDKDELRVALPLMGEDIEESKVDDLFTEVDKDDSGLIDFEEFCFLVKAMNSKGDSTFGEALRSFRMDSFGEGLGLGSAFSAVTSSAGDSMAAVSTAWNSNLSINPFSMRQAGTALTRMKEAGADDRTANAIVQAYYSNQSQEQMQECFDQLDLDKSGHLDKAEMRKFLPCLEDLPEERFEEMFSKVDADNSGNISFEEFRELIKAMGEGSWPGVEQMGEAIDNFDPGAWFR